MITSLLIYIHYNVVIAYPGNPAVTFGTLHPAGKNILCLKIHRNSNQQM